MQPPPPADRPDVVAPAGWLPDPYKRFHLRYWDGNRWTADVSFWWRQAFDHHFAANDTPDDAP
jgi:hypothetical protein